MEQGTTRGRLARGKELLRNRLTRRGVAFAAAAMGAGAGARTASAASMALMQRPSGPLGRSPWARRPQSGRSRRRPPS